MKKKTHCWENSKIKFTPTEKIWRVGSGRKKKYFVAATIKCAYPFPKSKKEVFSLQRVWHLPKHVTQLLSTTRLSVL
jgi:hypothetical protein